MEEIKKGYKGFSKGLVCRGMQYAENTVFEEKEAVICIKGLHFCENPLDVLDHYALLDDDSNPNEFAEVEALDECHTDDNKKYCTKKLKIGAKLTLPGFINACVDFLIEKTTPAKGSEVSDERSAQLAASGDYAQLAASGYSAKLAASGYSAKLECTGADSVICCAGINGMAKATKGCWITLAEWQWDSKKCGRVPLCVKTAKVDGKRIKADTWYKLENKKFVEVN